MASTEKETANKVAADIAMRNQVNIISIDTVFPGLIEEVEEARIDLKAIAIAKTSVRGKTIIGEKQGDHVTAYALYVEYIFNLLQDSLLAARNSKTYSTTGLLTELEAIRYMDDHLLRCFSLNNGNDSYEALELDKGLLSLRKKCNNTIESFHETIGFLEKSSQKQNLLSNITELTNGIAKIRYDYFYAVIKEVSQKYLLLQNKRRFVTFERNNNIKPPPGEGARIRNALAILRRLNEQFKESSKSNSSDSVAHASKSAFSSLSSENLQTTESESRKSVRIAQLKKNKKATEVLSEEEYIKTIANNILTLFFFPMVPNIGNAGYIKHESYEEEDEDDESELDVVLTANVETTRTNDIRILCYVVARHLLMMFSTFDSIGKDIKITKKIAIDVTKEVIHGWSLTPNDFAKTELKYTNEDDEVIVVNSNDRLVDFIVTSFVDIYDKKKQGIVSQEVIKSRGPIDSSLEKSTAFLGTADSPAFYSSGESIGSMEDVENIGISRKRNRKSGVIVSDTVFGGLSPITNTMQNSVNALYECKNLVGQFNTNHEIVELMAALKAREEQLKAASSSSMATGSLGAKNVSSTGFLSMEFSNASKYIEEGGKKSIMNAIEGLQLNTKQTRWFHLENGDAYNALSRNYSNLSGKAQHAANNLTKPLLYMSKQVTLAQKGLWKLAVGAGKEVVVNALSIPRCSLDGTMRFR